MISLFKTIICFATLLSVKGFRSRDHLTRYFMYRQLAWIAGKFEKKSAGRVLDISGSHKLREFLLIENPEVTRADFPETNALNLPFPDNSFDYVVSDQVLEHVAGNPQIAINEMRRVLKPGGILICTTCFVNEIHPSPVDFWRFSPVALRFLCREFSKIEAAGGWGNDWAFLLTRLGLRFCPVPEAAWHPVHKIAVANDERLPIVTWVVARK